MIGLVLLTSPAVYADENISYVTINEGAPSDPWQNPVDLMMIAAKTLQDKAESLLNWQPHYRLPATPVEKYSRLKQFGAWINDPNDDTCYNTRAKVLLRDSEKTPEFSEKNKCRVIKGEWVDPYTGTVEVESTTVQIDHMVPLKNAYIHGAWRWSYKARCLYANFLGNNIHLVSVDAHENMSKGDGGPESYMPPRQEFRCEYLKRWLTIKMIWNLYLGADEAAAIVAELHKNNCDQGDYTVQKSWIDQQRQVIMQNQDLCREPTPKPVPPANPANPVITPTPKAPVAAH